MYTNSLSTSLIGLSYLSSLASAVPFTFPNSELGSFPNVNVPSDLLSQIEIQAKGSLPGPNGPAPTGLQADTITTLQLICYNEITEVAYFQELYDNITSGAYSNIPNSDTVTQSIKAIIAQEEEHALNACGALAANNAPVPQTCEYNFPVDNFDDAINLAIKFTDVVVGTLAAAQFTLSDDGDHALIPAIGSIISQEGKQIGGFRGELGKIFSDLPFDTASDPVFAFSALNQLFVSNCPNSNYKQSDPFTAGGAVQGIQIPILGPLIPDPKAPGASSQTIRYTATLSESDMQTYGGNNQWTDALAIYYVNQQNAPVMVPITDPVASGTTLQFTAEFPFDNASQGSLFGNGLTIATLAHMGTQKFTGAADLAKASLAGPALFEM